MIAENKIGDYIEWSRELLEELGYPQGKVPMYVDSTCAMQMLKQGTGSFKRAKHIKVRFFWLKDLIEEDLIELIYMPTDELVADILTKPLNGEKFIYLLTKLIGWNPLEDIELLNEEVFSSIEAIVEEVCWNKNENASMWNMIDENTAVCDGIEKESLNCMYREGRSRVNRTSGIVESVTHMA